MEKHTYVPFALASLGQQSGIICVCVSKERPRTTRL
jgi:hypothetical protein